MAVNNGCVHPIFYAEQVCLKQLKDQNFFDLANLSQELINCFQRLTAPTFPKDYLSDLQALESAQISEVVKTKLRNYANLMILSNMIEDQNSSYKDMLSAILNIQEEGLNKDFYFDCFMQRFNSEIQKVQSLKQLVSLNQFVQKIPAEKQTQIDDNFYIKICSFLDFANENAGYIAETLVDLNELQRIEGTGDLIKSFFGKLIHKIQTFELTEDIPQEILQKIGVATKNDIKFVLETLNGLNFIPEYYEYISSKSVKFEVISRPKAEPIQTLVTDFGGNTPVDVEENKKGKVTNDIITSNEAGLTKKESAETKSTADTTESSISNNAESEILPHNESKEIINSEEIKSNSIEKEPTLTLSTSSRKEFECSIEGVREIMLALPIVEWSQIKLIDRIFFIQEKGLEVHRAEIFLEGQKKIVAVKTSLSKFKDPRISMQAEYMALVQDHPNFLKLYGAFWDNVNKKQRFTIVMELAFETLTQRIIRWDKENFDKTKKEEEALQAAINLVEAMTIMNKKDISHRDIKPDNIFITESNIYKIADFDVSKKIERDSYGVTQINKQVTISGTKHFMSPELNAFSSGIIIEGGVDYNKSDVYSLGLTILRMITNKNFLSWNIPNDNLQDNMYALIEENIESHQLKKILKLMLIMNPGERSKFREINLICHMQEATVRDDDYF